MSERIDLLDELQWRGLLKDCTDADGLRSHLADPDGAPRKIYAGFDPTADSLTIGNLVPIMLLAHVKRAGHVPVVVMGGGTGLIGDPSGKSAERMMMTVETIEHFVDCQRPIYNTVLDQIEGPAHSILNNNDWLSKISYIEALRDIGKHFSVNMMMQKESVKERLNNREQGISYTEFSYMILQAYDFAHLYEHEGVTVQLGGSDQYGNIIAGIDLIRRRTSKEVVYDTATKNNFIEEHCEIDQWAESSVVPDVQEIFQAYLEIGQLLIDAEAEDPTCIPTEILDDNQDIVHQMYELAVLHGPSHIVRLAKMLLEQPSTHIDRAINKLSKIQYPRGLTAPLVSKADGGKFGKTETGAVWLTANRTSPYAYYQFWLNATDQDAEGWVKVFTFLDQETIESLIARHKDNPGKRELQRTLAQEATMILHGQAAKDNAEAAGKALFSGDIASLDKQTMLEVFASIPTTDHAKSDLAEGLDMVEMLKSTGLASSNREARDFLKEGSVSVNGEKIDGDTKISDSHLLHGSFIAIRRGKKKWHMTKWS